MKDHMCPERVPNKAIGATLFALARLEMNESASSADPFVSMATAVNNQDMLKQFYQGFYNQRAAMDVYMMDESSALLYIRIFKCGNNFIGGWLRKAAKTFSNDNHNYTTKFPTRKVSALQFHDIASNWSRPPCVVTAIRDPVNHFLSAYNEMEWRVWVGNDHPQSANPPDYLSLPYTTRQDREKRFTQFVADVLMLRWAHFKGLDPVHIASMSRVLSAMKDELNLTFTAVLPSIQGLSTTWPEFVQNTCPHFPKINGQVVRENNSMGQHDSSQDPVGFYEAAKSVWKKRGSVAKTLCILHAMDYACWDNLPDGIPSLCQSVYETDEFANAIFRNDIEKHEDPTD